MVFFLEALGDPWCSEAQTGQAQRWCPHSGQHVCPPSPPRQSCCCPWWSCSLAECSPGYVALVFAYFSKKPLPLVDGSNVASIASEVLPRLTQVRKLFVLSLPVLLLYLAVLLLLLVIFLLTSCKGCCFPDVGLAPPAVAAAIVCTTLNFVNVRYYPPFLQYNFERTIF